jgi:hypothetical protein
MADLKAGNQAVDLFAGADGFAEVFPEDKYTVVKHLQASGHVMGMTGDGVNDAPALRQAEVGIAVSTATDVAKGAASVVLTEAGLTNIVALVQQGRTIYQRILTWIINKISRTILKAAFVAIAFIVTGKFVLSVFSMLLLVFLMDFATIALATDRVRPSKKQETWAIGSFIMVSGVLGVAMVAETLFSLWIGWSRFGLATDSHALGTFSFLTLLYFCAFSVVSVRERRWFWATMPGKSFLASLAAGALAGTALTLVGLPGLLPLPWWQTIAIFAYAMVSCLVVNDAVKVALIKWRVPNVVAKKPEAKAEHKPEGKTEPAPETKPEAKAESQPEAKAEIKPETHVEPKPEVKGEPKSEAKADAKPEAKPEPKIKPTPEVKPEAKAESQPEAKAELKPDAKIEVKPEAKAEAQLEAKVEPKPAAKVEAPSDLTPQLVKRVHQLYEELGREEVRAVQELEQEMHKDKAQK